MLHFKEWLAEAEYQGRDVPLNKPMAGDVKKSKVFVKNEKGNVVKVNFGDKNMTIKKHIPVVVNHSVLVITARILDQKQKQDIGLAEHGKLNVT